MAPTEFITVSSEDLMAMSDIELIAFADAVLGIVIPLGTKRSTVLTRIVNAAVAGRDGAEK